MAAIIQLPCYSTRTDLVRALDITESVTVNARVDRALKAARDAVDGACHRRFYNVIETHYWDWPNFQRAYPWRIWLDAYELADTTVNAPVVTSGGNVIPADEIFWGPWNDSPPYTFLELNRATSASFGQGDTPQQDVAISGTYGYWANTTAAGALAASLNSSSVTLTCTDSSVLGVGNVLICDSEWMLVQDQGWADTGQALQADLSDASADVTVAVTTGSDFAAGEVLLLTSGQMLVTAVAGDNLTVERAYQGTVLASHTGDEIYAPRALTVLRGSQGTTAASHSSAAPLAVATVPGLVKQYAVAEALVWMNSETSAYARMSGAGDTAAAAAGTGTGFDAIRDRCVTRYGRKARQRVI